MRTIIYFDNYLMITEKSGKKARVKNDEKKKQKVIS